MSLLELLGWGGAGRSPPLYVRGVIPPQPGVAVVGTRGASCDALRFTRELVHAVAQQGCSIWSGGAYGVDRSAHEAALEAGTPTVVVTAGGLDDPYPREHAELYDDVLRTGGSLVSLQPDGSRRRRHHFVRRNYVLAALTLATVVAQAPLNSGARYTANAARKLARPLFVVPGEPWSQLGAGSARELVKGATPIATAADLTAHLRPILLRQLAGSALWPELAPPPRQPELWHGNADARPEERAHAAGEPRPSGPRGAATELDLDPWDADAGRVLAVLGDVPLHADAVCNVTGLPYSRVSEALLTLCLHAVVVEAPPGHFRRAR